MSALWGLIRHAHKLEVNDRDLVKFEEEFKHWCQQLHFDHYKCRTAAVQLAKHAEAKALAEEEAASRRSFSRHTKWLQEGLANGLGRQHSTSKVALGWIPKRTARDKTDDDEDDGEEEEDHLRMASRWKQARRTVHSPRWEHRGNQMSSDKFGGSNGLPGKRGKSCVGQQRSLRRCRSSRCRHSSRRVRHSRMQRDLDGIGSIRRHSPDYVSEPCSGWSFACWRRS